MGGLLVLLLAAAPAAGAPLSVTLQPAWNGVMRNGAATEIGVTVLSDLGGSVALAVAGVEPVLRASVELSARQARTIWLPLRPRAFAPITVTARRDDGTEAQAVVTFTGHGPRASVAVALSAGPAADSIMRMEDGRIAVLAASAGTLPHTRAGYAPIDLAVIDRAVLAALDDDQRRNLSAYLRDCGKIVLVGLESQNVAATRQQSGCGGRHVTGVTDAAEVATPLRTLLDTPSPDLPSAPELQSLSDQAGTGTGKAVVAFFLCYLFCVALFARSTRNPAYLLILPFAATLISALVWTGNPASRRLVSWAETTSGDGSARYAAILQIEGTGRGTAATMWPADIDVPRMLAPERPAELAYRATADGTLTLDVRLGSRSEFVLGGTAADVPKLAVSMTPDGPIVINRDTETTAAGLLSWQGRLYSVPGLPPGDRWQAASGQPKDWDAADAVARLFRARGSIGAAALLIPFQPAMAGRIGADPGSEGWLLTRAD